MRRGQRLVFQVRRSEILALPMPGWMFWTEVGLPGSPERGPSPPNARCCGHSHAYSLEIRSPRSRPRLSLGGDQSPLPNHRTHAGTTKDAHGPAHSQCLLCPRQLPPERPRLHASDYAGGLATVLAEARRYTGQVEGRIGQISRWRALWAPMGRPATCRLIVHNPTKTTKATHRPRSCCLIVEGVRVPGYEGGDGRPFRLILFHGH